MIDPSQSPWRSSARPPNEPELLRPRRRRHWKKALVVAGGLVLVIALIWTKGFGLLDGIPGYRETYHDEQWGFTLSPPRPYVVKEDTETYTRRALLVFDPDVWNGKAPEWSAMRISSYEAEDYVQPSLADLTDMGDELADELAKDLKAEYHVQKVKVQDARSRLVGGAPALEVQVWYEAGYDVGAWEDWILVFGRDRRITATISTTEAYGTGSFASLREVIKTLSFDEVQW